MGDENRAHPRACATACCERLAARSKKCYVNGDLEHRVPHNLNMSFNFVEGESLIMGDQGTRGVVRARPAPRPAWSRRYVLRALGRSDELAHSSIRFTFGRFTTAEEIDFTVKLIKEKVAKLRELSPLWDMYKEGIDINSIQWAAH